MGQYKEQLCGKSVWHGLFECVLCHNVDDEWVWPVKPDFMGLNLHIKTQKLCKLGKLLNFFVSLFVK